MGPAVMLHANFYGYSGDHEGEHDVGVLLPAPKPLQAGGARQKAHPWVWAPVGAGARQDGLVLKHWVAKSEQGKASPFAVLGQAKVTVHRYTDAIYNEVIAPRSGDWSRADTDQLLHLCEAFDCRFIVVHDRFVPGPSGGAEEGISHTVEDLKDRFYRVQAMVMAVARGQEVDTALQTLCYDVHHETQRKKQLVVLLQRTARAVDDEECLSTETKRLAQRLKKIKERAGRAQTVKAGAAVATDGTSMQARAAAEERARKRSRLLEDTRKSSKRRDSMAGPWLRSSTYVVGAGCPAKLKDQLLGLYAGLKVDLDVLCYTQRVCAALEDLEKESCDYLTVLHAVERLEHELQATQSRQMPGSVKGDGPAEKDHHTHAIDVESTDRGDGMVE